VNRRVEWDPVARAEITALLRRDARAARRIYTAIGRFADQNVGDVRKLVDQSGVYRLRVGDWRVLFSFADAEQTVLVLHVLPTRRIP
jgi:mRNA-degrading endonuclease RelE of RelBE toxin-antitoxin system